jgi:hypothetical protein
VPPPLISSAAPRLAAGVAGLAGRGRFNPGRPKVDESGMVRALLPLCLLAAAVAPGPSRAELYRCDAANGGVRFADSPHACPHGRPHEPRGGIQRMTASEPPRTDAAGSPSPGRLAPTPAPAITPEEVLLARADVGAEWEVVEEVPEDAARDPDLVAWGVRARRARHYTRVRGDAVQVCSIEVWVFRDAERARMAQQGFAYPQWRFAREGAVLIAVHGLIRPREGMSTRGVFAACVELEARTRARAAGFTGR